MLLVCIIAAGACALAFGRLRQNVASLGRFNESSVSFWETTKKGAVPVMEQRAFTYPFKLPGETNKQTSDSRFLAVRSGRPTPSGRTRDEIPEWSPTTKSLALKALRRKSP